MHTEAHSQAQGSPETKTSSDFFDTVSPGILRNRGAKCNKSAATSVTAVSVADPMLSSSGWNKVPPAISSMPCRIMHE